MKNNVTLALVSTILSLVLSAVLIEIFFSYRYENWKSAYANGGNWYGGLTTVSKNPVLMWEYRPNAESNALAKKIGTNRYGFRDHDHAMKKPADTFRIAFVGDSVTLGLKVDSQDVFVEKFAAYTAELYSNLKIQPMNFGIDGYNIAQVSELVLSKVLQFEPDKIVYVMCLNDFDFEESSGGKSRYFKKPNSFILERFEKLYREIRKIDFHLWHFKKNREQSFDTLARLQKLLDSRNVDFQVVVLPIFEFRDSDKNFTAYPLSEMHFEITQFLAANNMDFIDLLGPFGNHEKPPKYFAHDAWHPNKEGHDFIARQLLKFVALDRIASPEAGHPVFFDRARTAGKVPIPPTSQHHSPLRAPHTVRRY